MRTLARIDLDEIRALLDRHEFFWLDAVDPSVQQLEQLAELLGWHPLALEDATEFGQRPKLDDYTGHALLVFYGVDAGSLELVEVHLFVSGDWVVTVRRGGCHHLAAMHEAVARHPPRTEEQLVYRVLDALTDSFAPLLAHLDARLEDVEDCVMTPDAKLDLREVVELRRELAPARRIAAGQRDLFTSVGGVVERMPGLERSEARDEFRDVADHMTRTAEVLDGYRERIAAALDLYANVNQNRLNEVTERLTLVATVFLPLTFVVGFFGQNFKWLTDRIDSFATFLIYGVGGLVVPVLVLLTLFWRAGLLRRR